MAEVAEAVLVLTAWATAVGTLIVPCPVSSSLTRVGGPIVKAPSGWRPEMISGG